ncbi:flagellar assembly protein A [Sporosarcina sp. A2]|uniref:flagellar assembly protein A n=1 Tax=Sporosarcina sp. A2 TaxID=3393449 RepID=UPI003D79D62A
MGKAITVRGKSVEQAVETALNILCLDLSDVRIHVNKTAESNDLTGVVSRLAEVTVTPVHYTQTVSELYSEDAGQVGVRIQQGYVEVHEAVGMVLPTIEGSHGVSIIINGEKIEGSRQITEADTIHIRTVDELTRAQLSITVREQGALALLTVTPGKKVTRTVRDTEYSHRLAVEANETHEIVNDLSQRMIRDTCTQLGISAPLDKRVLWEACETVVPYEAIVARGIFPKPGLDGDVEVQIDVDGITLSEENKVNYREQSAVQLVQKGQLIATVLPPIPGQSGEDVFGNEIMAEDGQPAHVELGKNSTRTGSHIFASCSGKLVVEREDIAICIDIADSLELEKVNFASGNIRFDGDVVVKGTVSQGCLLEATGAIEVAGEISKSDVFAGKSVHAVGHVSSSTIEVGAQVSSDANYATDLDEILPHLHKLGLFIENICTLREIELAELDGQELNKLFRIGLGETYATFQERIQTFSLRREPIATDSEWIQVQTTLYCLFVNTMNPGIQNGVEFSELLAKAEQLVTRHRPKIALPTGRITIPYALNSTLTCSGSIDITGNGLAQCNVYARLDLQVEGICRGGELTADRHISLKECGSKRGGQTIVRTKDTGSIVIGIAHAGTILIVGEQSYQIRETLIGVTAKLHDGLLNVR